MKQIPLSKRGKNAGLYFAEFEEKKVGENLFNLLNASNWNATARGTNSKVFYARRTVGGKDVYMHRFIWEYLYGPIPDGYDVDHKDKNGLNNTPTNLRLAPHDRNCLNRRPCQTKREQSSRYKGVSRRGNRWIARLQGKPLGSPYDSEKDAARAYDRAAFALDPEFAVLNFPDEWPTSSQPNITQRTTPIRAQLKFDL